MVADSMTVVTLNTWNGQGEYAKREETIVNALRAANPDIVFLQEVFAAPGLRANMSMACAVGVDRHYVHHPARIKTRSVSGTDVVSTSGLCLLSRTPLIAPRIVTLPTDPADGERLAQVAYVEVAHRHLALVNVHLPDLPNRPDLRRAQLDAALVALIKGRRFDAAIVAGDFNAAPADAALAALVAPSGLAASSAFDYLERPFPTLAAPVGEVSADCDDHIYALQPPHASILSFSAVDRLPAEGPVASSGHHGIRATIHIQQGGAD